MKIGITVWGEQRISPVFDSARTLLVVHVEKGEVTGRQVEIFRPDCLYDFVRMLRRNGITVLICGAISNEPARYIEEEGITMIPFITGCTEQIIKSYVNGSSILPFMMPGCRGRGSQHGRQCCRRGKQGLPEVIDN